jgi:hypothetical protein
MAGATLDKTKLLASLAAPDADDTTRRDDDDLRRMSLARSLRTLLQVDHERLFLLCRDLMTHLLGARAVSPEGVPEE